MTSTASGCRSARQPRPCRSETARSSGGGAARCTRSWRRSWREPRRRCVREGRRSTSRGARTRAPLPTARGARVARQRRLLGHRDGARSLRFVLPSIPEGACRGGGTAHREGTRLRWARRPRKEPVQACSGRSPSRSRRRTWRIARRLAETPVDLCTGVTSMVAPVIGFGALCVTAGWSLRGAQVPFWVDPTRDLPPWGRILSVVLRVPAGCG